VNPVTHQALLLDIGYVVVELSWRAVEAYDAATGTTSPGRDGLAPEGALTSDEYWDSVARSRGMDGITALFRALVEHVPDQLFDPAAVALMHDAQSAGCPVGVLTNDAYTFIGREFFAARPEFAGLDAFVDSTEIGVRKPAPRAYLAAAEALAVPVDRIVFLDDTPECVDGAHAVGMTALLVDPSNRTPAFTQARHLLALPPTP
jgi:HAD superfamily hydrolase (TIGR01509 family)